jgi:short subunit dehydrogenase-like uncharacterized protein
MSVGKPPSKRAMVFGGYGTFGTRVCEELAARGLEVSIVGRDSTRANRLASRLAATGAVVRSFVADATLPDVGMLRAHHVIANCAGPFSVLGTTLAEACVVAGVPYVDLSDDRAQVAAVCALDGQFRARGIAAMPACSSLPAISGALALLLRASRRDPPQRANLTLFIGNKNPKGTAAIRSAVGVIGRPIAAPQGTLRGFSNSGEVVLPPPFGRRRAYVFESPDYDVLPALLGVEALEARVGFELPLAGAGFALLSKLGSNWGGGAAALLAAVGRPLSGMGHSGGVVLAELYWPDGERRFAALSSVNDGQRAAALPCAIAAARLAERRESDPIGAVLPWDLFGVQPFLDELCSGGFTLTTS